MQRQRTQSLTWSEQSSSHNSVRAAWLVWAPDSQPGSCCRTAATTRSQTGTARTTEKQETGNTRQLWEDFQSNVEEVHKDPFKVKQQLNSGFWCCAQFGHVVIFGFVLWIWGVYQGLLVSQFGELWDTRRGHTRIWGKKIREVEENLHHAEYMTMMMYEVHRPDSTDDTISVLNHKPAHRDAGHRDYGNWELWESSAFHTITACLLTGIRQETAGQKP